MVLLGFDNGDNVRNRIGCRAPNRRQCVQGKAPVTRLKWPHEFVLAPEQVAKGGRRGWLTAEWLPQFAPRRVPVRSDLREDQCGESAAIAKIPFEAFDQGRDRRPRVSAEGRQAPRCFGLTIPD